MEKFKDLISDFNKAFYSDDFESQKNIQKSLKSLPNYKTLLKDYASHEYRKYLEDKKSLRSVLYTLNSGGWETVRESDSIKIECQGGGAEFLTKCTIVLKSNIFNVLAVLSEADLVHTWVEPLKDIQIYEKPNNTRLLEKYMFEFPWPLSERHCMIEVASWPRYKSVVIVMKTPKEDNYLGKPIYKGNGRETWMRINIGCMELEYIDENTTRFIIMTNCNPNISFLPYFIINFSTKHALFYMMETVRDKICNIEGSIYQERMNSRREYYDFIRKLIGVYMN